MMERSRAAARQRESPGVTSFLIDEMFPVAATELLRETHGRDAVHVGEIGLRAADDAHVAATGTGGRPGGRYRECGGLCRGVRHCPGIRAEKEPADRRRAGCRLGQDPGPVGAGFPGSLPWLPLARNGLISLQANSPGTSHRCGWRSQTRWSEAVFPMGFLVQSPLGHLEREISRRPDTALTRGPTGRPGPSSREAAMTAALIAPLIPACPARRTGTGLGPVSGPVLAHGLPSGDVPGRRRLVMFAVLPLRLA
jgi:hypothetical protein